MVETYTAFDPADTIRYNISVNWNKQNTNNKKPTIKTLRKTQFSDTAKATTTKGNYIRVYHVSTNYDSADLSYDFQNATHNVSADIKGESDKLLFLLIEETKRCLYVARKNPDPLSSSPKYYHLILLDYFQDLTHEETNIWRAVLGVKLITVSRTIVV